MEDYFSSCVQCPRKCSVSRSQNKTGFCRETSKVKIALACLHFGEEPLVTVFGGSGTIFFSGCTLRCSFCQNYQISQNSMGKEISKDEFIQICLTLQENGAENINLVTGSHFIPKIAYYIEEAVKSGVKIPFCWNSSAYESTEMLELLKDKIKIWLPDLKTLSPELSKNLFDAENYPEAAKKSIKWMIDNFPLKFSTEKAVKTGHAYLVIVSEEASDNTRKSFMNMTEFYDVPCYCYGSKEALGRCIGKEFRASLAVTDENLARAVENKLKKTE